MATPLEVVGGVELNGEAALRKLAEAVKFDQ
jgi:hypothetical protein